MKKLIFVISLIVLSGFLFGFSAPDAKAATLAELQAQIQQLLAQIAELQEQLQNLTPVGPAVWCHTFNVNLKIGDSGTEVKALRTALAKEGFSGLEAMGGAYEFDERVASAVVGFQEKYASEVLAPWGLTHGTGYVGPTTRAKLNKLYGCGVVRPYIKVLSPNGGEKWVKGNVYTVRWESKGVNLVRIYIFNPNISGSGSTNYIVPNNQAIPASQGYYNWTIGEVGLPVGVDKGAIYKIRIDDVDSNLSDPSDNYFSIVSAGTNLPPVIDGLSAPTQLRVSETGIWTIKAHDPENGPLTYSVRWGDEVSALTTEQKSFSAGAGQTTTFTHSYSKVGNYTISFTVTDDKSQTAKTSVSVEIVSATACTDSDGGKNYYVKGSVLGKGDNLYDTDYCINTQLLREYYCQENEYDYFVDYTCPYGCKNGACLAKQACIGEGEKGNIITGPGIMPLTCCSGLTKIANSWPTEGGLCLAPTDGSFICSYCGNGVCGLGENSCNCSQDCKEKSITVISPNGGEKWMEGNTYKIVWDQTGLEQVKINIELLGYKQDGTPIGMPYAITTNISAGQEYYSWTIPSKISGQFGLPPDKYKVRLANYKGAIAVDGEVINGDESDNYFAIVPARITCTDSDGGRDYFIKGTVTRCENTGGTVGGINIDTACIEVTDACVNSTTLKEYYCENEAIKSVNYTCSYGCKDGACQAGITVISPNGGEKWEVKKTYGITWASEGTNYKTVLVNIYLWKDAQFIKTIALGVSPSTLGGSPSVGKYSWAIPSDLVASDKYQIRVYASGIAKSDLSNNYFSIVNNVEVEYPASCIYLSDGVQSHYMATCGNVNYNPVFDLNKDKIINASDFGLISVNINNESWCDTMKASTENPCEATGSTGLKYIENQLADISNVISELIESIENLLGR